MKTVFGKSKRNNLQIEISSRGAKLIKNFFSKISLKSRDTTGYFFRTRGTFLHITIS